MRAVVEGIFGAIGLMIGLFILFYLGVLVCGLIVLFGGHLTI